MEKLFNYQLVPHSLEQQFRTSKEENVRKQLLRVYGMAAALLSVFIILEIPNLPHIGAFQFAMLTRAAALLTSIVGIFKLRRTYRHSKDEPFVFISGLIIFAHILVNNYVQDNDFVSIAAWDIAAIFTIYSLVPISLYYQIALALILTLGSQALWITVAVPQLGPVEAISTPLAYIAANCFGITLALSLNRIQRQEFEHLQNEKTLRADLESTMNTRDQLFSVLAHDLRGPIGALGDIGKLLNSTNPIEFRQREKLVNLICVGSQTSYELLDNLLNWALSETGSLEPELKPIKLQESVSANIDLLVASANNKKISLTNQSQEDLTLLADRKLLDTILRNLIANAIKFTPEGGAITIAQKTDEDGTAKITVADTGIGIPQERLERIFGLGFDDTSCGTNGERGSNLGLRICYNFTQKLNGKIEVASKPDQGTQFTLSLPLAQS